MAKKFSTSDSFTSNAFSTTETYYTTEDGKQVKETDYSIKFSNSGAATGASIGYKIAGPPGVAAGFIIGGIVGPAD